MSTARLFLYGTLRDPDLYQIVAGEPLRGLPATLHGWRQVACEGGRYPSLVPDEDAAEGLIVAPSTAAMERLDFYETGFGYHRGEAEVETAEGLANVFVYRADQVQLSGDVDWRLDDWQRAFGSLTREAARDYIALRDRFSPEEAAARFAQVLSRAACRLTARDKPSPRGPGPEMRARDVELLSSEQPFIGYFALRRDRLRFPLYGGGLSEEVTRESLVAVDAVTVLPYDPEADSVLVLRQFRHGPFVRDDPNPWSLEPVAGRIDPGETPESTARREMQEEAGIAPLRLERMATYYPSPGPFSEHVISYLGIVRLDGLDGKVAGLDSEAEDIMLHVLTFDELMNMIESGVANTGTLVLSALWLARERARLRQTGFS